MRIRAELKIRKPSDLGRLAAQRKERNVFQDTSADFGYHREGMRRVEPKNLASYCSSAMPF